MKRETIEELQLHWRVAVGVVVVFSWISYSHGIDLALVLLSLLALIGQSASKMENLCKAMLALADLGKATAEVVTIRELLEKKRKEAAHTEETVH